EAVTKLVLSGKTATARTGPEWPAKTARSARAGSDGATSKARAWPSASPATNVLLSGAVATESTVAGSAGSVATALPSAAFQIRSVLSAEPETILEPSLVTATALT